MGQQVPRGGFLRFQVESDQVEVFRSQGSQGLSRNYKSIKQLILLYHGEELKDIGSPPTLFETKEEPHRICAGYHPKTRTGRNLQPDRSSVLFVFGGKHPGPLMP